MAKKTLLAIHPGEFLAETLQELGIAQAAFARTIGVSPTRISHVVKETRPMAAELALLFGRTFDQSPQYWLNFQADHDLKTTEASIGPRLRATHSVTHASLIGAAGTGRSGLCCGACWQAGPMRSSS